jgi:peroxiredoxin
MTAPATASPPQKPPRRRPGRLAANLAVLAALFLGVQWWQARPLARGPAPPLAGQLVTGESLDLQALRGQTVLVYFWAVWCPVCRAQQGNIQAIARDYPVLSVAMQSGDAAGVRQYLRDQGISFAVLNDPLGQHAGAWGVASVPTSFIVDGTGAIRHHAVGYTTEAGLRARLWAAGHD